MYGEIALRILEAAGAIRSGHFVLNAGDHADRYVNKDAIGMHPLIASRLCRRLVCAIEARLAPVAVAAVAAPAIGGVILSQWVAHHLDPGTVDAVYAEKADGGGLVLRRGFAEAVRGRAVLLVEDVVTTAKTLRALADAVDAAGGKLLAAGVLVNRSGCGDGDLAALAGVPHVVSLLRLDLPKYPAADCPLCAAGVPVDTDLGHGAAFLAGRATRPL